MFCSLDADAVIARSHLAPPICCGMSYWLDKVRPGNSAHDTPKWRCGLQWFSDWAAALTPINEK